MRKKNYYELNNIDLDKVYYFVPKGRGNSKKGDNTLNIVSENKELINKLFKEADELQEKINKMYKEEEELQEKIDRLREFVYDGNKFNELDDAMQGLLKKQLEAMKEYHLYLTFRITLLQQREVIDEKTTRELGLKGTLNNLYGTLEKEHYEKLIANLEVSSPSDI